MSARALVRLGLVTAIGAVSACGMSSTAGNPSGAGTGTAGTGAPADGGRDASPGDASGSTGVAGTSGAQDAGGVAGTFATGSAGSTGTAGTTSGGTAGTGPIRPPCRVEIKPVSSADFDGLPAGTNATLRVRGIITGEPQPVKPTWTWTVTILTNNESVPIKVPDPQDPSLIELPLTHADRYDIHVTVSESPRCEGDETATTTFTPAASYWVRIMPPSTGTALPPYEGTIKVAAGQPLQRNFYLQSGTSVTIDPKNALSQAVGSYVLISSPQHTWTREGDTHVAAFTAALSDEPGSLYDVLVVPIGAGGPAFAPLLFSGTSAGRVAALPTILNAGVAVTGSVGIQGGATVAGATVVLRAGALPSTLGLSQANGSYSLYARAGRFSAVILPPDGVMLPEAHLDATADSGIDLPASPVGAFTCGFAWRSDLGPRTLGARFLSGTGAAAAALDVRLDSAPDGLPDVGTLSVTGGANGPQTFHVPGALHRTGTTDASGAVSFAGVPRGTYQLVAVPPVSSLDGLTVTSLDLTAGASPTPVTISLAPKVSVTGQIANAPAGTRIVILDDRPTLGRVLPASALGSDGAFALRLDAGHPYHLLVDPPAGNMISRVPLGPVQTGTSPQAQGSRALPHMLPFTGQVMAPGGQAVAGARAQVFCMGAGPDCIDYSQLSGKDPLPLIEGVTDETGAFALWIPDPALPASN